jgi:MinD superfamily P-loop ATPase
MKELTVISGKGGSGKTSLVAAFAALGENLVLVDADVDAADLHLVVQPQICESHEFRGGLEARINPAICSGCGDCLSYCQFDAIDNRLVIDETRCEGCGVCAYFCPMNAIELTRGTAGMWYISRTEYGPMVHAKLGIMQENSGMLVSVLRKEAQQIAGRGNRDLILIDGPPGIGCPVISSITGTHAVLIITEPTVSGFHDLKRVGELARSMTTPAMVCVNKWDVNPELSRKIKIYARDHQMAYVGSIPYSTDFAGAMVARKNLVEFSNGAAAIAVKKVWQNVTSFISKMQAPIYYPTRGRVEMGVQN